MYTKANPSHIGTSWYRDNHTAFNMKYFGDKQDLITSEQRSQKYDWHNKIDEKDYDIYTITHEYGHLIENDYTRRIE